MHALNSYYDSAKTRAAISEGRHRDWVGGMWEIIGRLQHEFLVKQGLQPDQRMLDVGCGCFRAGVHLVDYLKPGCYYGIDISQELLDAGYEKEIEPRGLQAKLPRENLLCDANFSAGRFGVVFDVGIAQSVFTHLPLNHLKLCLWNLASAFKPGACFYATAFICPPDVDWASPRLHEQGGITTHPAQDPFHYQLADILACTTGLPWSFEYIGHWGHPRDQQMLKFTRTA